MIADEEVEAAWNAFNADNPAQDVMRAALEAARAVKSENTAAIVMSLRMACGYEFITDEVRKSCSHASNGLVVDAAACISDLAAALRELISSAKPCPSCHEEAECYVFSMSSLADSGATLVKWGLDK